MTMSVLAVRVLIRITIATKFFIEFLIQGAHFGGPFFLTIGIKR